MERATAEDIVAAAAAEKVVGAAAKIDLLLAEMSVAVEEFQEEDRKVQFRRAVAALVLAMCETITRPIALEFPDLHPDRPKPPAG